MSVPPTPYTCPNHNQYQTCHQALMLAFLLVGLTCFSNGFYTYNESNVFRSKYDWLLRLHFVLCQPILECGLICCTSLTFQDHSSPSDRGEFYITPEMRIAIHKVVKEAAETSGFMPDMWDKPLFTNVFQKLYGTCSACLILSRRINQKSEGQNFQARSISGEWTGTLDPKYVMSVDCDKCISPRKKSPTPTRQHNWIAIGMNGSNAANMTRWYESAVIFDPTHRQFLPQSAATIWSLQECLDVADSQLSMDPRSTLSLWDITDQKR